MSFRTGIVPAILAIVLTGASANAAPVAPLPGLSPIPVETVQFRGGNWGDHPMLYSDYYRWHQRQWDAIEGRRGSVRTSCARLRGYSARTHTYVNRNGRRVACP